MKKKYTKKAARGLQSVAVPEQGSNYDVLSSTASLASAGSQFGPGGAIAGGVLGFATGLLNKNAQDKANREAIARNNYLKANREVDGVDESIDQRGQYKSGTKMIEIEGKKTPEIHTDKNFRVKNLGNTPHSKGGNKVEASEGDIVFPTQNSITKFNKIANAIQEGDTKTLKKEKNKLPDDNSGKHPKGTKRITSDDHYDNYKGKEVTSKSGVKGKLALDGSGTIYYPNGRAKLANGTMTRANNYSRRDNSKPSWGSNALNQIGNNLGATVDVAKRFGDYQAEGWGLGRPFGTPSTNKSESTTNKDIPFTNVSGKGVMDYGNKSNPLNLGNRVATNSNKSVTKSPINTQGKRVSGNTTAISTPSNKALKLSTDFGNPSIGDGSDLKESNKPFKFDDSYSTFNNPTVSIVGEGIKQSKGIPGASSPSTLNNVMQMAGVANNLFQGLKSPTQTTQTYFDPQLNTYTDRSQSLRNASTQASAIQSANARNVSGGSAANLRANQNQANLSNLGRQNQIDEQEMARRDAIEASNTGLKNAAGQYNLQRKDDYENQLRTDRLLKQQYLDTAASDIGQLGMARQEESYLRSRDAKAEAAQLAGYNSINGRYQHKSNLDGSTYFEPDADSSITRFGTSGGNKKSKNKSVFAKGTKSVKTSKYKMK